MLRAAERTLSLKSDQAWIGGSRADPAVSSWAAKVRSRSVKSYLRFPLRTLISYVPAFLAVETFRLLALAKDVKAYSVAFAASAPIGTAVELDHAMFAVEREVAWNLEDGGGADLSRRQSCRDQCCDQ